MKNILKKLALLAIPVLLWLAFFIAFEPNNYFGLKASATSSQPVARVRAYQQDPGTNLILGDSRLAHFDMGLVDSLSGQSWQNLAFGGASLKETLDLADYLLDSGHDADTLLVEVSFYTLNAGYNTDRFATLEETLNNPLAYCFNLEYNVNALTVAMDTLRGTPDTIESGDWVEADYLADDGTVLPLHRKLYDYTATITPRCKSWALNDEQFNRLHTLARRCQSEGVRLIVVLPPMADNVRTEVCDVFGITETMQGTVLPTLAAWADECGFTQLDPKHLRLFGKDKPEVLVASCMYDNEAINSHVYNNIGRCNKIVNLHWEQMLSDTQEEGDWFNMNGNAKRCVQTCWGKRTAARLQAHGMDAKNTPVTGAVMMDFLRPEFDGYFKDKETLCREFGLDPAKQLHLYISSFGYASMNDDEVAELSKMAGTDFTGFAKTNRVSMQETLRWFDEYLGAHPEVELVYRRHPSEWNSPALEELEKKRPNFHVIFADSVKQWIVAADSISIWMSTAIAEVYMAGKSCHILRPVPIEHEYDPVIYKDAHYVTHYGEFAAAMAEPEPPFPIAKDVIEGYFDPGETPAYKRMADLLEDVYKNPPRDEPMGDGFTPHFNKLKFCALAGVHFLYRRGWEPKKLFAFCPPLANFAQRIYGYVDKAYIPPEEIQRMEARIRPYVK